MPRPRIRASINFTREEWPRAQEFLLALGRPDLARAPQNLFGYSLRLGGDDEPSQFKAVAEVFDFSKNVGLIGRENQYSTRELESAHLLSVRYTKRARGISGPESGTQYDFESGCPCCGTGAHQTSQLVIRGKLPDEIGLVQIETGEWLLSEGLAGRLQERLTGVEMRPVTASRAGLRLPWVQLLPSATLPQVGLKTTGIEVSEQCRCCLRDGHFGTVTEPFELHYPSHVCGLADGAMFTWEHFGLSALRTPRSDTVLAKPVLVASSALYRDLRAQNIRGLAFTPVICDD